jgi:hypothetical protein
MSTGERVDHRGPVLLVRKRPGVVGESRRSCHLVPVPDTAVFPAVLTAFCGERIEPGSADVLEDPVGMPCVECLVRVPMPRAKPDGMGPLGEDWPL